MFNPLSGHCPPRLLVMLIWSKEMLCFDEEIWPPGTHIGTFTKLEKSSWSVALLLDAGHFGLSSTDGVIYASDNDPDVVSSFLYWHAFASFSEKLKKTTTDK